MSGSFDVILDDGTDTKRYYLNRSYTGSEVYDEKGYYRDYEEFRNAVR